MTHGIWSDIYVLSQHRTPNLISRFLDAFLPHHIENADEYEVPRFANDPIVVFDKADELIHYCCAHQDVEQAIYWSNKVEGEPRSAMVFFTADCHLILGLATDDESLEEKFLTALNEFSGSQVGYITCESPPEMTAEAFRELANSLSNK